MNSLKMALPLLLSLGCVPGQAVASTLLGADIQTQIVFADTYVTTGANSTVFGSALSDVATTGANATVTGNLVSVGASTIGANAQLTGNMTAGGVATTGANSTVGGSVQAGGAASTGENSKVVGDISAISPISIGAGGSAGSLGGTVIVPNTLIGTLDAMVKNIAGQITFAQAALSKMVGTLLAPTITTDTTLRSGVYNAASLSTTAGTTLTLDGQGLNDQFWVFNITDILATGASTNIVLLNGGLNNSVIWNTGGYASLGANSNFLGTILADTYVSVGAHTDVTGVGGSCGGIFSATSYVSTGDSATIGGAGCLGLGEGFGVTDDGTAFHTFTPDVSAIPEPATWAMIITGFGVMGAALRQRRRGKRALQTANGGHPGVALAVC